MKKNMGSADRIIRLIVAAVIATLYATHVISGTLGIVLLVLAGVFILTSLISFGHCIPFSESQPVKQKRKIFL